MDASISGTDSTSVQVEVIKKAMDVQEKDVLKALDSIQEQPQSVDSAQKTGKGVTLDTKA